MPQSLKQTVAVIEYSLRSAFIIHLEKAKGQNNMIESATQSTRMLHNGAVKTKTHTSLIAVGDSGLKEPNSFGIIFWCKSWGKSAAAFEMFAAPVT